MKRMFFKPCDFPCGIEECPPGPLAFKIADGSWGFGFKTEYRMDNGKLEAYNLAEEFLCLPPDTLVTPLEFFWDEL